MGQTHQLKEGGTCCPGFWIHGTFSWNDLMSFWVRSIRHLQPICNAVLSAFPTSQTHAFLQTAVLTRAILLVCKGQLPLTGVGGKIRKVYWKRVWERKRRSRRKKEKIERKRKSMGRKKEKQIERQWDRESVRERKISRFLIKKLSAPCNRFANQRLQIAACCAAGLKTTSLFF